MYAYLSLSLVMSSSQLNFQFAVDKRAHKQPHVPSVRLYCFEIPLHVVVFRNSGIHAALHIYKCLRFGIQTRQQTALPHRANSRLLPRPSALSHLLVRVCLFACSLMCARSFARPRALFRLLSHLLARSSAISRSRAPSRLLERTLFLDPWIIAPYNDQANTQQKLH